MPYTKTALLDAINLLVANPDPQAALEALEDVWHLNQRHAVRLSGELADLNALVTLRSENPEAWARVQALIDAKRADAGLAPCWPPQGKPAFDKKAYQRRLMALRREWSGRAVEIENLQRGERDKLKGTLRMEYERRQLATWGDTAEERVAARKQANGGKISRAEIDAIKAKFWEELDSALDEREAAVRAELMKPAHLRKKL